MKYWRFAPSEANASRSLLAHAYQPSCGFRAGNGRREIVLRYSRFLLDENAFRVLAGIENVAYDAGRRRDVLDQIVGRSRIRSCPILGRAPRHIAIPFYHTAIEPKLIARFTVMPVKNVEHNEWTRPSAQRRIYYNI